MADMNSYKLLPDSVYLKTDPVYDERMPLPERFLRAAGVKGSTLTFVGSAAGKQRDALSVTWAELCQDSLAAAAILQARGIKTGDHIALLGPTTRELVTAILASWFAGASISILPIPMRFSSVDEFVKQTRTLMKYGDIKLLLLDSGLASFHRSEPGDPPVILLDELMQSVYSQPKNHYNDVGYDPDRLIILQFTSGSTSSPKGVQITSRTLEANLSGMVAASQTQPDDVFVSWLPLYHDMGLVGLLMVPMTVGCSLVLASPQDFLSRPADWLRWIDEYRGTVTSGPNFSWVLAARAAKVLYDRGEVLDLSCLRIALSGAEPIDPAVVENLIKVAEPHRFKKEAVFCAFGMAELSLGGTFPPPMRGMVVDTIDRKILETEGLARQVDPADAKARAFPLLGRPIPGLQMRICNPQTGEPKKLRQVGELEIKGSSVTIGYYKRDDLNKNLFEDGWLRSGDLAYFAEGPENGEPELVICGRIKDVIIISGRNIFPEDIERKVGHVQGVRAGNVISFGIEGGKRKESLVVVAEVKGEQFSLVRRAIREAVIHIVGFPPRDIVLVQPGTLPKTSSGKLQRSLCKQYYLSSELKRLDDEKDR